MIGHSPRHARFLIFGPRKKVEVMNPQEYYSTLTPFTTFTHSLTHPQSHPLLGRLHIMSMSRALCSRCASHVTPNAAAATTVSNLGSLAQFSSDAQSKPDIFDETFREKVRRPAALSSWTAAKDSPKEAKEAKEAKRTPTKPYRRPVRPPTATDLFNAVLNKDVRRHGIGSVRVRGISEVAQVEDMTLSELYTKLMALEKMTTSPVWMRFGILHDQIWPLIIQPRKHLPKALFVSFNNVLLQLCKDLAHDKDVNVDNKICTRISLMLQITGNYDLSVHTSLILNLCRALCRKTDAMKRVALADELFIMWKMISQMKRERQPDPRPSFEFPPHDQIREDIALLNSKDIKVPDGRFMDSTSKAFAAIFPQFEPQQAAHTIPGLLVTLSVLSRNVKPSMVVKVAPLLEVLRIIFKDLPAIDEEYVNSAIHADHIPDHTYNLTELRFTVKSTWPQVTKLLLDNNADWAAVNYKAKIEEIEKAEPTAELTLASLHTKLRKAYATDNIEGVVVLWERLLKGVDRHKQSMTQALRDDPAHMNFWFFVFCAMGRSDMLESAQALMTRVGMRPNIKTYTAMMHGWKMVKDYDKIEGLWSRIISSDMQLDTHIWTERVSALMELGRDQEGVQAIAEMMAAWKARMNPKQPTVFRKQRAIAPSIEVINAAFKFLVQRDKQAAFKLLDWAGKEGIKPDVLTYNILLGESVRTDLSGLEVPRLLKEMKQADIEPDTATFTIILEQVVGGAATGNADEQVLAIDSIFSSIKAAGLQSNLEVYGKVLHAIASNPNGADRAINAVIRNMKESGYATISPHMALTLVERHLDHSQAVTSASVTALLRQHGFTSIATGDQRLWERVMSAHAVLNDVEAAFGLYKDLYEAGRPPDRLFCLRDLLAGLIKENRMADARLLVDRTLLTMVRRIPELNRRRWKHHFWHLAETHDLLGEKEIPEGLRQALHQTRD